MNGLAAADEHPLASRYADAASGTGPGDPTARFDRRFERAIKCRHEAPAPEAPVVPAAALAMRASWPRLGAAATRERWYLLPTLREDASPLTGRWWRHRVHRADDPRRAPLELGTPPAS